MKFVEIIYAIYLLPAARKHLLKVKQQLQNNTYEKIIETSLTVSDSHKPIISIVKSYFWACRLLPKCNCLPRSIALFQYLKAAGFKVEHKFGVNKDNNKLAAHAWVEYQQKPLNESENLKQRFKTLNIQKTVTNSK